MFIRTQMDVLINSDRLESILIHGCKDGSWRIEAFTHAPDLTRDCDYCLGTYETVQDAHKVLVSLVNAINTGARGFDVIKGVSCSGWMPKR